MAEAATAADIRRGAPLTILDYGMGNLRSVEKAFEKVGVKAVITHDAGQIAAAPGLILPGVGAFPRAMSRIRELGWDRLIAERSAAGVPLLGICLGYQLLFERSEEFEGATGLGLIEGEVKTLEAPGLKVPHIGWEPTSWEKDSPLVEGIPTGTAFYFVHSLAPRPAAADDSLGVAGLTASINTAGCSASRPLPSGGNADGVKHHDAGWFSAAISRGNVYGVQFHPEKSSEAGLRLLANFAKICAA